MINQRGRFEFYCTGEDAHKLIALCNSTIKRLADKRSLNITNVTAAYWADEDNKK